MEILLFLKEINLKIKYLRRYINKSTDNKIWFNIIANINISNLYFTIWFVIYSLIK